MIAEGVGVAQPSAVAARVAASGAALFVLLLAALHVVEPGMDPAWHFISEYTLTEHGWMMRAAFLALAAGYASLAVALREPLRGTAGRIGLVLLWVSALGLALGGVFPTDPLRTPPEGATLSGKLHQLGGTLGLAMPLAVGFVGWRLARHPGWMPLRRRVVWTTWIALLGCGLAIAALAWVLGRSGGTFGPGVWVGWPNRAEVVVSCGWVLALALHAVEQRSGRTYG